jgi:peptide chain release factor 1
VRGPAAFYLAPQSLNHTKAANPELVPSGLITRARDVALEHKQLTEKLANGFDTRSAKKLGEYSPIVNALSEWDKANEVSTIQRGRSDNHQMC